MATREILIFENPTTETLTMDDPRIETDRIEVEAVAQTEAEAGAAILARGLSAIEPIDLSDDELRVLDAATAITSISSAEDFQRGGEILVFIRRTLRRVADHYKGYKDPVNALRGHILDLERSDLRGWEAESERLTPIVDGWRVQEAARIERERREAQAAEDQRVRAEQQAIADALKAQAAQQPDKAVAKAQAAEARSIEQKPLAARSVASRPLPTVAGLGAGSEKPVAEILDLMTLVKAVAAGKVPLAALEPERLIESHPWLNRQAGQMGEQLQYPGVRIVKKRVIAAR